MISFTIWKYCTLPTNKKNSPGHPAEFRLDSGTDQKRTLNTRQICSVWNSGGTPTECLTENWWNAGSRPMEHWYSCTGDSFFISTTNLWLSRRRQCNTCKIIWTSLFDISDWYITLQYGDPLFNFLNKLCSTKIQTIKYKRYFKSHRAFMMYYMYYNDTCIHVIQWYNAFQWYMYYI